MKHINMKEEILNPNCSEVVWRLEISRNTKEAILKALKPKNEDDERGIHTSDDEEGCLSDMLSELKGVEDVDKAEFILIENQTGQETLDYVEECFEIAKRYKKGEITLSKAEELEHKAFENNEEKDYW